MGKYLDPDLNLGNDFLRFLVGRRRVLMEIESKTINLARDHERMRDRILERTNKMSPELAHWLSGVLWELICMGRVRSEIMLGHAPFKTISSTENNLYKALRVLKIIRIQVEELKGKKRARITLSIVN